MFEFLKNLFKKSIYTGVNQDLRSDLEKDKDFSHEEFAQAQPIYGTKEQAELVAKQYPLEKQFRTSSCVAHGDTLALGIESELEGKGFIRLSKAYYYRHRVNYPNEGMNGDDAGKIAKNIGSCMYSTLPTPTTEKEINSVVIDNIMNAEASHFKAKSFVTVKENYNDIDTLASISAKGKAIPVLVYTTSNEFGRTYPLLLDKVKFETAEIRHCVCVLPNSAFIENGVKYITVQDSVPFGGTQIRYLSEEFVRKRVYYAKYFTELLYNSPSALSSPKPVHTFTQKMKVGDKNDEVLHLQECLAFLGLHPIDAKTGFYGGITRNSVCKFQEKYSDEILKPLGLVKGTGTVGINTINKLNNLFK